MTEYRRELARIESTTLGVEDHGIFTAVIHVSYGGRRQGIGCHNLSEVAGKYIPAMLNVCGADEWEKLRGKTIYVLFEPEDKNYYRPLGIESLPFDGSIQMIFSDFWPAKVGPSQP